MIEYLSDSRELMLPEQVAIALLNKGIVLGQLSRPKDALGVYDQLIERFGDSRELVLQEQVAQALLHKGITFGQLNRFEDELGVYDQLIERFADSSELVLQEQVAMALFNKGIAFEQVANALLHKRRNEKNFFNQMETALFNKNICFKRLTYLKDALAIHDQLIKRFADSGELVLQELVVKALFYKDIFAERLSRLEDELGVYDQVLQTEAAKALLNKVSSLDRAEDALDAYDQFIERFADSKELVLQKLVADAWISKSITLGRLNHSEDALSSYNQLIEHLEKRYLKGYMATALWNKSVVLHRLNRDEEMFRVYDQLIERFANSGVLTERGHVARAFNAKGDQQMMLAKKNWQDQSTAKEQLNRAKHYLQQALERADKACCVSMVLGNLAYVEFLLGHPDAATIHLRKALEKAGNKRYHAILEDIATYPIAPDTTFRALLERVCVSVFKRRRKKSSRRHRWLSLAYQTPLSVIAPMNCDAPNSAR